MQKVVFNEVSFYNMKPLYPDIKNVILTKKIITGQQLKNLEMKYTSGLRT